MRVACICNQNNNLFALTRYLRDRGLDAELLLLNDEIHDHFHPSADTYDLHYQRYTRQLEWGDPRGFDRVSPELVRRDVQGYDRIVACGSAPGFLARAGRAMDVFAPYGTDIYFYPFQRFYSLHPRTQLTFARYTRAHRQALRAVPYMHFDQTNPTSEALVARSGFRGTRLRMGMPMLYTPQYNPGSITGYYDRSHWLHEFRRIRAAHELVVFYHARHLWHTPTDPFLKKGTEKLLGGVARFVREHPGVRVALVTCEYGQDVPASRRLIRELGIEPNVFWFPKLPRKEIMIGLSLADVGAGEFECSWLTCGVVYEVLAMAKPLLHYRDDAMFTGHQAELYPLMNAREEHEIARALEEYVADPARFREMGEAGRRWLQRHAIDRPVDAYVEILNGRSAAAAPRESAA